MISWYGKQLSIYPCELTHDMCVWYIYVGLGIFPWTGIKSKNSYSPWWMMSIGVCHQSCEVQEQEEHIEEITYLELATLLEIMTK